MMILHSDMLDMRMHASLNPRCSKSVLFSMIGSIDSPLQAAKTITCLNACKGGTDCTGMYIYNLLSKPAKLPTDYLSADGLVGRC